MVETWQGDSHQHNELVCEGRGGCVKKKFLAVVMVKSEVAMEKKFEVEKVALFAGSVGSMEGCTRTYYSV